MHNPVWDDNVIGQHAQEVLVLDFPAPPELDLDSVDANGDIAFQDNLNRVATDTAAGAEAARVAAQEGADAEAARIAAAEAQAAIKAAEEAALARAAREAALEAESARKKAEEAIAAEAAQLAQAEEAARVARIAAEAGAAAAAERAAAVAAEAARQASEEAAAAEAARVAAVEEAARAAAEEAAANAARVAEAEAEALRKKEGEAAAAKAARIAAEAEAARIAAAEEAAAAAAAAEKERLLAEAEKERLLAEAEKERLLAKAEAARMAALEAAVAAAAEAKWRKVDVDTMRRSYSHLLTNPNLDTFLESLPEGEQHLYEPGCKHGGLNAKHFAAALQDRADPVWDLQWKWLEEWGDWETQNTINGSLDVLGMGRDIVAKFDGESEQRNANARAIKPGKRQRGSIYKHDDGLVSVQEWMHVLQVEAKDEAVYAARIEATRRMTLSPPTKQSGSQAVSIEMADWMKPGTTSTNDRPDIEEISV